jgi:hypothetical protein
MRYNESSNYEFIRFKNILLIGYLEDLVGYEKFIKEFLEMCNFSINNESDSASYNPQTDRSQWYAIYLVEEKKKYGCGSGK